MTIVGSTLLYTHNTKTNLLQKNIQQLFFLPHAAANANQKHSFDPLTIYLYSPQWFRPTLLTREPYFPCSEQSLLLATRVFTSLHWSVRALSPALCARDIVSHRRLCLREAARHPIQFLSHSDSIPPVYFSRLPTTLKSHNLVEVSSTAPK